MKLESNLLGIPLALLVFVLIDATVILVPVGFMQAGTQSQLTIVEAQNAAQTDTINKLLITPSPTVVPTIKPTVAPKVVTPVVKTTVKPVAK